MVSAGKLKGIENFAKPGKKELGIAVGICTAVYFIYSYMSNGFYQHDEAAHFLSMRRFWYDPHSILGNWAKPGFKLIYAIPALAGHQVVTLFNCFISALTALFSYKVAAKLGFKWPVLAFALTASQPFWIQLAFRNYSELISACLLMLAILMHLQKHRVLPAFLLSYLTLIRQEFYLFIGLYGIYLIYKKQWLPLLLLGVGPLLYNSWGWLAKGDPLYLINSVIKTGERYSNAYPRQGFDHYFLMSMVVFGPVVVTSLVLGIGLYIRRRARPLWIIIVPFGIYFLLHALFNVQLFEIGTATGGNLRYLLVISPLAAIWATQAIENKEWLKKDGWLKVLMLLFLVIVALYMSYEHNNIRFTIERNWMPLVFSCLLLGGLFFLQQLSRLTVMVIVLVLVYLPLQIEPLPLSPEDKTVKQVAAWIEKTNALKRPILSNHILLSYFLNKISQEYPNGHAEITRKNVKAARTGTLIFWDSHYSYRPNLRENTLPYTYFTERAEQYNPVQTFYAADRRFGIIVFEKVQAGP